MKNIVKELMFQPGFQPTP